MLWVVLGLADAIVVEFSAEPQRNKIVLRWKTGQEDGVSKFFVERSLNNQNYTQIGEVAPKGSNSRYEFVDDNLPGVKSLYYYRLRISKTDGTSQYTESISVIPNLSGFAKTWGSIKALFQ
ncbi:MAG: hypothetical protein D6681_12235 [Calditrichaeota bacterium]|nr:MAG: hypothetical protein D6681_12235 [Calditrichota bacterium]